MTEKEKNRYKLIVKLDGMISKMEHISQRCCFCKKYSRLFSQPGICGIGKYFRIRVKGVNRKVNLCYEFEKK